MENIPQKTPLEHQHFHGLHTKIHRTQDFFPGQRSSETVKLLIQNHWIADVKIFFGFLCLPTFVIGLIIYFFVFFNLTELWWWDLSRLFFNVVLLFIWLVAFVEMLKNELSVIVVTNERIVDMVQTGLFSRKASETSLDRVQDVIGLTRGWIGTFLDIGELEIETAGREQAFVTRNVKSPQLTARKILEVQRQGGFKRRSDLSPSSLTPRSDLQKRSGDALSDEEIKQLRRR